MYENYTTYMNITPQDFGVINLNNIPVGDNLDFLNKASRCRLGRCKKSTQKGWEKREKHRAFHLWRGVKREEVVQVSVGLESRKPD